MKSWLIATLLFASVLYVLALDSQLDLNGDSPRFVMLARSLHDGQGYMARFDFEDRPETQIPYLYPLMLSAVVGFAGPTAYLEFKLLSLVSALAMLGAIWFWMSQWTSSAEAKWIVVITAFLTQTQLLAGRIATEAPFLAASFACLGFIERVSTKPKPPLRDWACVVLLIGICFHLRAAGWSLLVTFFITLLWRRGRKTAVAGAAFGLAACSPWLIRISQLGFGYSSEFVQNTAGPFPFAYRLVYNFAANVAKSIPDLFFYPFFASFLPYEPLFFVKAAVGSAVFAVMLLGLRGKLSVSAGAIYFVVYAVGALSWTVHGDRYVLPILPLMVWALLRGFGKWNHVATYAIVSIGLAGCLLTIYKARVAGRPAEESGFIDAAQRVANNTSPSARVMSRYPTWVAATAGNRGIRWSETSDAATLERELTDNRVEWLIVDHIKVFRESAADRFAALIRQYPDKFELRFESASQPPTRVYRFLSQPR